MNIRLATQQSDIEGPRALAAMESTQGTGNLPHENWSALLQLPYGRTGGGGIRAHGPADFWISQMGTCFGGEWICKCWRGQCHLISLPRLGTEVKFVLLFMVQLL